MSGTAVLPALDLTRKRELIEAVQPPIDLFQSYSDAAYELEEARRTFALKPRRTADPAPPARQMSVATRASMGLSVHERARASVRNAARTWPKSEEGLETNGGRTIGGFAHPFAKVGYRSGFGRQVLAGVRSAPKFTFGPPSADPIEALRLKLERTADGLSPGLLVRPEAGPYNLPPAIGWQPLSNRKTGPAFAFSTATRFAEQAGKGARVSCAPRLCALGRCGLLLFNRRANSDRRAPPATLGIPYATPAPPTPRRSGHDRVEPRAWLVPRVRG